MRAAPAASRRERAPSSERHAPARDRSRAPAVPAVPRQRAHRRWRGGERDSGANTPRVRSHGRRRVSATDLRHGLPGPGPHAEVESTQQLRGQFRLDQTAALYELLKKAERAEVPPADGVRRVREIISISPRFGRPVTILGHAVPRTAHLPSGKLPANLRKSTPGLEPGTPSLRVMGRCHHQSPGVISGHARRRIRRTGDAVEVGELVVDDLGEAGRGGVSQASSLPSPRRRWLRWVSSRQARSKRLGWSRLRRATRPWSGRGKFQWSAVLSGQNGGLDRS
jgi:hypothetical protein